MCDISSSLWMDISESYSSSSAQVGLESDLLNYLQGCHLTCRTWPIADMHFRKS